MQVKINHSVCRTFVLGAGLRQEFWLCAVLREQHDQSINQSSTQSIYFSIIFKLPLLVTCCRPPHTKDSKTPPKQRPVKRGASGSGRVGAAWGWGWAWGWGGWGPRFGGQSAGPKTTPPHKGFRPAAGPGRRGPPALCVSRVFGLQMILSLNGACSRKTPRNHSCWNFAAQNAAQCFLLSAMALPCCL